MPVARANWDRERPCSALSCFSRAASPALWVGGDSDLPDGDKDLVLRIVGVLCAAFELKLCGFSVHYTVQLVRVSAPRTMPMAVYRVPLTVRRIGHLRIAAFGLP